MPNETPADAVPNAASTTPTDTPKASGLDALFDEIERVDTPSTNSTPVLCEHCHDDPTIPHRKCRTCVYVYCGLCASPLDPEYCKTCLNEPDAAFIEKPLIDEDGVQHNGRELHVNPNARFFQPRFGTLAKRLVDMLEPEIEEYIKYYRSLVKQAETALDFRRVVLGSAELELAQRQDATRRKLRADKTKYPVKTLTVAKDGTGKKKTAGVADLMKMMEMLKALDANRKAKAASSQVVVNDGTKTAQPQPQGSQTNKT